MRPGLTRRGFVLNSARPLFRNNPWLRRAVNFAVDREAVVRAAGSPLAVHLTEQYLPPSLPGFRNARIYPLRNPDLRRAGRSRAGIEEMPRRSSSPSTFPSRSRTLRPSSATSPASGSTSRSNPSHRARISPGSGAAASRSTSRLDPWSADYLDPYSYINLQLEGRFIGQGNYARFRSRTYDGLMRDAARLQGRARYSSYGALDIRLTRDAAPLLVIGYDNEVTLVSRRVGCVVLNPGLDLAAACLKR